MTDLERLDSRLKSSERKYRDEIIKVVDCFNQITGRSVNYSTLGSLKLMLFWMKQGYDVRQFGAVFDYKYRQFKDDLRMKQYISIDTFCRQDKFENTLEKAEQEWRAKAPESLLDVPLDDEPRYEKWKHIITFYPRIEAEVRFFKASEFNAFFAPRPEWCPTVWQKWDTGMTFRKLQAGLRALEESNDKSRLAPDGLYQYLKGWLLKEIEKER